MAGSLFIVSRTKPGTYNYMKLVSESEHDVIFDRRKGDRRRIHQRATPERRHGERRRRDVMTDLQKSGWGLVCRSKSSSAWSLAERYDAHQHCAATLDGVGDAARRRRLAGDIRGLDPSVRADAGALAKRRYDDGPA